MHDSSRIMEGVATISAFEPRGCQRKSAGGQSVWVEFHYFILAFLVDQSVDFWDSIRYTSQTFLEDFVGTIDDALAYTWRFTDVESRNEKFEWVVSTLISRDDLFDFLIPGFDHLGTFRVMPFVPLAPHDLEYTFLACIPD